MKFINIKLFALLVVIGIIYFNIDELTILIQNILVELTYVKEKNFTNFFLLLIIINFIFFLTPVPTFFLIIFNGFALGTFGFFFSYLLIIICSIILFNFSKKNSYILNLKSFKKLKKKINKNKNIDINFFIIASSRYVLPYFIHNIFFGSIIKNLNIFLYSIAVAEIPVIFVFNKIGVLITSIGSLNELNSKEIINIELIISMIVIFFILLIFYRASNYLKRKLKD